MIITDELKLNTPCENASIFEAPAIISKLWEELDKHPHGAGLAASQIGILKRVCIIKHHKTKIALVNPKIIETYDHMEFHNEGCLSYINQYIITNRYNEILVKDDINPNGFVSTGFEAVIIQHEIDHTLGITMIDRQIEIPLINEKCWCGSGKKYKKCHQGKRISYV